MTRFAYNDQLTTSTTTRACAEEVHAAMEAVGATVQSGEDPNVEATMGSQAVRILGGILAPENQLPVQIQGHVEDAGEHRVIYLHVEEAMGFGMMLGMEGKYRQHCQNVLAQLRSQLSERLSAVPPSEIFHQ